MNNYFIKVGNTFFKIIKSYNIILDVFKVVNSGLNPIMLHVDQVIHLSSIDDSGSQSPSSTDDIPHVNNDFNDDDDYVSYDEPVFNFPYPFT